jgi:hypothetical protein
MVLNYVFIIMCIYVFVLRYVPYQHVTVMSDGSLKRLPRHITENTTVMSDGSLKRLPGHITEMLP